MVRTRAAVRELVAARDTQRRRRGNVCCLALFALFILVMAMAVIYSI